MHNSHPTPSSNTSTQADRWATGLNFSCKRLSTQLYIKGRLWMVFDKCTHLEVTLVCIMVFFPLLSFHGASCSQTTAAARVCFSFDPFLTALRHLLYVVCEPLAAHPHGIHFNINFFWGLINRIRIPPPLDPRPLLASCAA